MGTATAESPTAEERFEDVVDATERITGHAHRRPLVSVSVVGLPGPGVREDLVGGSHRLELRFGDLVTIVGVRVVLAGQAPVGRLHVGSRRIPVDA